MNPKLKLETTPQRTDAMSSADLPRLLGGRLCIDKKTMPIYTIHAYRGLGWDSELTACKTPVVYYELFKHTARSRTAKGMYCTFVDVQISEPMSAHKRAIRYLRGLTATGTAKLKKEVQP